jgi:hypothetical protein
MGLDQFAYRSKAKYTSQVDFVRDDADEEFFYWRKHPNLHGWMEAIYRAKGGSKEKFNCTAVILEGGDIDILEKAVENNALPQTSGFFFGASRPEDKVRDLEFISRAREAIRDGFSVYYTSWW